MGVVSQVPSSSVAGSILSQSPQAGSSATAGTAVNVSVAIPLPPTTPSELLGDDADGDGIRDSVNEFLRSNFADASIRTLLEDIARKFVIALQSVSIPDQAMAASNAYRDALKCASLTYGDDQVEEWRVALMFASVNTEARLRAYIRMNNLYAGKTITIPTDEEMRSKCH